MCLCARVGMGGGGGGGVGECRRGLRFLPRPFIVQKLEKSDTFPFFLSRILI